MFRQRANLDRGDVFGNRGEPPNWGPAASRDDAFRGQPDGQRFETPRRAQEDIGNTVGWRASETGVRRDEYRPMGRIDEGAIRRDAGDAMAAPRRMPSFDAERRMGMVDGFRPHFDFHRR